MRSRNEERRIESLQLVHEKKRLTELFRYFRSTSHAVHRNAVDIDSTENYDPAAARLSADPALNAFSQLACLRLNCDRAFISLIDDRNQHIVAETTKSISLYDQEKRDQGDDLAMGEMPLDLLAGVCAGTIKVFTSQDGRYNESTSNIFADQTRYVINDFTMDDLYKDRPYVKGFPYMRYYAEVPLVTPGGYVIGSFCVVDNKPRHGLSDDGYRTLQEIASTIMRHLGLVKTDYEHTRAGLLLDGLNHFVQGEATALELPADRAEAATGDVLAPATNIPRRGGIPWPVPRSTNSFSGRPGSATSPVDLEKEVFSSNTSGSFVGLPDDAGKTNGADSKRETPIHDNDNTSASTESARPSADTVFTRDQVGSNFQRASRILRQAMDLDGVVFISAPPSIFGSISQESTAKMLGYSARETLDLDEDAAMPNQFTLPEALHQSLLAKYPRGHVFAFEAEGYLSDHTYVHGPEEPENHTEASMTTGELRSSIKAIDRSKIDSEIQASFPAARSMIFMPLWDIHKNQWFAGCLAWTTDVTRVLSSEEFGYFSAFGNSIMAEVSRLELVATDLAKSDFISSISHELRSPLHGVLGSAELLRGMNLSNEQLQMMEMIEKCGRTLLDTMEHILDYSKINSLKGGKSAFQKARLVLPGEDSDATDVPNAHQRPEFDLSNLVEDTVEGTMAGHRFSVRSSSQTDIALNDWNRSPSSSKEHMDTRAGPTEPPEVILNIENCANWSITSDVGAWRRILLNLLGNALKYTASGFIEVALRSRTSLNIGEHGSISDISLIVRDTGRGISPEYLQNHLYKPFMQEDTFSVGAGLGLSIVEKLVAGLGGRISVDSEVGIGTQVTVTVPVPVVISPERLLLKEPLLDWPNTRSMCLLTSSQYIEPDLEAMQLRSSTSNSVTAMANAFTIQAKQWFNLNVYSAQDVTSAMADIVVLLESDAHLLEGNKGENTIRTPFLDDALVIVICSNMPTKLQGKAGVQWLMQPIGPRKLAKALASWFSESEGDSAISARSRSRLQEGVDGVNETLLAERNQQQDRSTPSDPEAVQNSIEVSSEVPAALESGLVERLKRPGDTPYQETSNIPDPPLPRKSQRPHVLLVDDNAINLKMLVVYMERLDCSYATATNGQEALEIYQQSVQVFDVVLMDISMPIMDGFESTRQIRLFERALGRSPTVIVALTGLGSKEAQRKAFRSGVDLFLSKPVPMRKLRGIVDGGEA